MTENMEKYHSVKRSIIIVASAIGFSSFTLWLVESWIKYPLFLFETLTIIVLSLIISGCDLATTIKQTEVRHLNIGLAIDLFLIASALSLLTFNIFQVKDGLAQLSLGLLCTSLLSGYALLNIFGLTRHFSKLENLVLSYILSYAFTGFMTLVSLPINQDARTLVTLGSFIVVGSISAFKHRRNEPSSALESFSRNIDFLALLVALAFYAISFCLVYPGFALLPGSDISPHYASSIVLGRTPDIYIGSTYLLAHLHESTFLSISNPSLASAQTALVVLNFMLPLAFYVMAKPYLEKIDGRLPALATVFWALFTNSFGGFAWLHFVYLKLSMPWQTQLQLLSVTADKTYNGTLYGILGLWYVPAFVSLTILMVTIFLMWKKEIPKSKHLALFSVFIAVLYLTHVTAAVAFALFLAVYGAISRNQNFMTEQASKSSIIGFLFVTIIYGVFSVFTARFIFNISLLLSIIGPIAALFLSLLVRKIINRKPPSFGIKSRITSKTVLKVLVLLLLFVYAVALASWASLADSFHTWQVDVIGFVPWFMYPLMLGINGFLAIIALYHLTQDAKSYDVLTLFVAFLIFTFIAGKIVSTTNIYLFDVGYWEKRFIWLIKLPLATLAPIPLLILVERLKKARVRISARTAASVAVIGTVVLYGASTTFLNLEYWHIVTTNQPSLAEMEAITAFQEILNNDPRAWLVTVTSTSADMATFAAPADQLVLKQLLYTAYTREMAFTQLYRHPAYSHPYIYLHTRDMTQLNKYGDRFLMQYLTMLPVVFENSEVKICNVSKLSFPQPNSENVLVVPLARLIGEQSLHTSYNILSHGFYNYTVAYDLDDKALDASTVILAFDPPQGNILNSFFEDEFNQALGSWSVSKGSWRIEDGKLVGGETGSLGEGIILSPISAENFTATFKAKPLSGDAASLNYVSLVYSWTNSKSYRIADVMFGADGFIHVHFRTVIDEVESTFPLWPGIKTDSNWEFGNEYNVTVTVNGTSNHILINDKPILSLSLDNIAGRIGLRYFRFYEASFDDFSISYTIPLSLRPVNCYLDYLQSGGRVIVLNTDGYGFFADELFLFQNTTVSAKRIEGPDLRTDLPTEIQTPKLIPKEVDASVLSLYVAEMEETPFILRQNFGSGELFYVNLYPIIQTMHETSSQTAVYELLGRLLDDLNLPKLDPDTMLNFDGYVKEIHLRNDAKTETPSLLFPLKLELEEVNVEGEDGRQSFQNVTGIAVNGYSQAIIETDSITIEDGKGFYTVLKINSTFAVKPSTGSMSLKITTQNEEFNIDRVNHFSVTPTVLVQLLARTPTLSGSEVTFIEFYPSSSLQWRTRTDGQNLRVTGLTEFSVALSDSYSALTNVKLGESFQRDPPIVMFDELSTLPTAIFWTLLLLPVFAGIILVFRAKEPTQDSPTRSDLNHV